MGQGKDAGANSHQAGPTTVGLPQRVLQGLWRRLGVVPPARQEDGVSTQQIIETAAGKDLQAVVGEQASLFRPAQLVFVPIGDEVRAIQPQHLPGDAEAETRQTIESGDGDAVSPLRSPTRPLAAHAGSASGQDSLASEIFAARFLGFCRQVIRTTAPTTAAVARKTREFSASPAKAQPRITATTGLT